MIIRPYDTTVGNMIRPKNITKDLTKYLSISENREGCMYEYDGNLIFITGKNNDELDLPICDHPVVLDGIHKNTFVVLDVRSVIKYDDDATKITDMITDKTGFNFKLLQATLVDEYVKGNYGVINTIVKQVAAVYAQWISATLTPNIGLDIGEKLDLEVICAYFFYTLNSRDGGTKLDYNDIVSKVATTRLSIPVDRKYVDTVLNGIVVTGGTVTDLVNAIQSNLRSPKKQSISVASLTNFISGTWFGRNTESYTIMALENIPTLVAMINEAMVNKSFRRAKLATIINQIGRKIKVGDMEKWIADYMDEKKL